MIQLDVQPISSESFAPYGELIDKDSAATIYPINEGHTRRFHRLAGVDTSDNGGVPVVSIFESSPLSLPLSLKIMERHPLSTQAFVPLSQNPYLVVVAPAGDFSVTALRAFLVEGGKGISYHRGTWHHYNIALGERSDFLVIDRQGPGVNCDEIDIVESNIQVDWGPNI
ncbi:MAG: ureidoglycolate lyase [Oceanicoccus sp.]